MLTVCPSGAINGCQGYLGNNVTADASFNKITSIGPVTSCPVSPRLQVPWNSVDFYHLSFPLKGHNQLHPHHSLPQLAPRRWLCRSRNSISPDDEFRSSRNIAISLLRRYRSVIDRGAGNTLKEFIAAGVNAYALGCTDEGLRKELMAIKDSGIEIQGMESYAGTTRVRSKIFSDEVDECILWLRIVFITILCTPQPTIIRWSSTQPVSDESLLHWKGFCAVIANAYYMRGMAWLPVKTLQLEQMAVMGRAEEPSVVASRMRLVFSTLEVVSPQWPRV